MSESLRIPRRVRHELKFRTLSVVSVKDLTPTYRRIVLTGDDLEGFVSPGFDDHVKVFPPRPGEAPVMPTLGPDGPVFPEPRPAARDYTPRAYDPATRRLTLDFVTGHGGPATEWAMAAAPGVQLGVGGPRGSTLVPTAFADHVLIGDETALPAIARRLEELPAEARATVVVAVKDPSERLALTSPAALSVTWVDRGEAARSEATPLAQAVEQALTDVERGDAYVWIAAEAQVARTLRAQVVALGFDPRAMKAAGYWREGGTAEKVVIED